MKRVLLPALLLVLALGAGAGRALAAGGADSLEFLLLDGHARPAALGGAYSGLASDANALRYNPAGLGFVAVDELSITHNQYVQSVRQQQISAALRSGWGAELNYLDFGKLPRTTISSPDGTGERVGLDDLAFAVGYGKRFGAFGVGAAGRYIRESADRIGATGMAADLGALWKPEGSGLSAGFSLLNAGPDVKYQSIKQKLPTIARLGAAYSFEAGGNGNTFAAELSRTRTDSPVIGVGFETVFSKNVAFRLGWTGRNDTGLGLTGGVGWLYDRFVVGYAFSPYGDLGLAHRLTLTLRWGEGATNREKPLFSRREERAPAATDSAAALFADADARLDRGDYAGALKSLDLAEARMTPDDPRLVRRLERRGTALLRSGKPSPARESFVEAIKEALRLGVKDGAVTDSYVGLGLISMQDGNPEYALRLFLKALHLDPKPETKALLETRIAELRAAGDAKP